MTNTASISSRFYTRGSLGHASSGLTFALRNRNRPVTLVGIRDIRIDATSVEPGDVSVAIGDAEPCSAAEIGERGGVPLPLGAVLDFEVTLAPVAVGEHRIRLDLETEELGLLAIDATDIDFADAAGTRGIPRYRKDNCSGEVIERRRDFVCQTTGIQLKHVACESFDPRLTAGNIENFIGVAQVPIGLAGPLKVLGESAQGEFYVPLATSEGTLVASYNRGMKLLRRSGGVRCTVAEERMQRAPVFTFTDAVSARAFTRWVEDHMAEIRAVAGSTDRFVHLIEVECYLTHRFAFLRLDYSTGDAAGQNMVGKATFAACNWILQNCTDIDIEHFYLEANIATDKKPSALNRLRTRGTRVTAEATVRNADLRDVLNTDAVALHRFANVANIGTMLAGAGNNGCHAVNGITAIFIATGQDVANIAEASDAFLYTEVTADGDLYISVTVPSLIVATVGGGTDLPTQRECLKMLDCHGAGKARKLAEIVAGTVLAGELSLAGAITAMDWVSSHEALGRNPPEIDPTAASEPAGGGNARVTP